jgi:hypothetical protein
MNDILDAVFRQALRESFKALAKPLEAVVL